MVSVKLQDSIQDDARETRALGQSDRPNIDKFFRDCTPLIAFSLVPFTGDNDGVTGIAHFI